MTYRTIAEDIEWLRDVWWHGDRHPTEPDLRRGSAVLRRLLVDGNILTAWRDHGFPDQPTIIAPDGTALAAAHKVRLEHAASLVVGGGRLNGINAAMIGAFRVFNPETGQGPDSESGFAVLVTSILRDASSPALPSPLDNVVERVWRLTDYLSAPGAVRRGEIISRHLLIQFFANYAGGANLDRISGLIRKKTARYELIAELEQRVNADTLDGLHFELLSIGQAIGRSADMHRLAATIRTPPSEARFRNGPSATTIPISDNVLSHT
jgi:hypothetical protein